MNDRFKFRAIVKGFYYIDTTDKCEEFEPSIFLKNIDVLDMGDNIGISEEDLEIAIRKQYPDLQNAYIERIMENFRDNSNGIDTYITITPEQIYQSTGLKDKNGKLIYEGDIVRFKDNVTIKGSKTHISTVEHNEAFNAFMYHAECMGLYTVNKAQNEQFDVEVIGNIYENPELLEDTECQK